MSRFRVKLGERESDVLMHLARTAQSGAPVAAIVDAMEDQGVPREDAAAGVPRALHTLHELGLVMTLPVNPWWHATSEGVRLVADAEQVPAERHQNATSQEVPDA